MQSDETARQERHDHADRLAEAVALDMTTWWYPSVEGFYERVPKAALVAALTKAKVSASVALDTVEKVEAAKLVAKAQADKGWLPELLRTSL